MGEEVKLYKVIGLREYTELGALGEVVTMIEVTFQTKSGLVGRVTIPKERFTERKVAELIKPYAEELEKVYKLTE